MIRIAIPAALSILALGACSDRDDRAPVAPSVAAVTSAPESAAEPVVALGLTARQLEDADILGPGGSEVGEVERVLTGPTGVTGLLVEVEDSQPDRYVTVPLDGLTVVQRGDDRDLQGSRSREQMMALPETPRP